MIRVIRSDLRLRLDRKSPYNPNEDDNKDDDQKEESSNKNKKNLKGGWNWKGEFEHEEGLLECFESVLTDF